MSTPKQLRAARAMHPRNLMPPPPKLPTGPPRAAIYIRVSTGDYETRQDADGNESRVKRQTTENQLPVLEELARRRGWVVVEVYEDNESAKSGDRPAFQRMLADAEGRKFDVLMFWSLDRLTREGAYPTLEYLNRLSHWGVGYASAQEQYLDTAGPFKDAIIAILAAIAQQERLRMGARIKAGLRRVRASGKRLGKAPAIPNLDYFRRANEVYSTRELMGLFHCGRTSIVKYRAILREQDEANANHNTNAPAPADGYEERA